MCMGINYENGYTTRAKNGMKVYTLSNGERFHVVKVLSGLLDDIGN